MDLLTHALQGARAPAPAALRPLERALVVGGGGTLGSAVLAEALVGGRFQRVAALVSGPLTSALRGFEPLSAAALQDAPRVQALAADVAFIVFERARHANGRDDAFLQPAAAELLPIARALRAGGVRRLLVVVPHAPALLPQALKAGFASSDEGAVAALGFEHLVLLRAAQAAPPAAGGSGLERFARWWLSQLGWMVPPREQPVRAVRLAALVVQLARLLPQAAPGTRVVPPELLWQAAQGEPEAVLSAWLGRP
jgi:hypothetical protein